MFGTIVDVEIACVHAARGEFNDAYSCRAGTYLTVGSQKFVFLTRTLCAGNLG